jgi:hypothetical protein
LDFSKAPNYDTVTYTIRDNGGDYVKQGKYAITGKTATNVTFTITFTTESTVYQGSATTTALNCFDLVFEPGPIPDPTPPDNED